MIKGFVLFRDGRIPFVIKEYRMELFTDEELLTDFVKEYNFKNNYVLSGQYFNFGFEPQKITILVERSVGNTCYLSCYLIESLHSKESFDTIGIQSPYLDDIFRFSYNYIYLSRGGFNFTVNIKDIYTIPFRIEANQYYIKYCIGHNGHLGLLEDFDRKGEVTIPLVDGTVQECYKIVRVLHKFSMFMISQQNVSFKHIALYNKGRVSGWFYCNLVCIESVSVHEMFFCEFDVMKYVPKILNNIALDPDNKISKSVPLGHLYSNTFSYSPQRFIEQVMAFEYLFEKIEPKKANDPKFYLKKELKFMFDLFPTILSSSGLSSEAVSNQIKKTRVDIVHGNAYYYDFNSDTKLQYMIMQFDKLLIAMSLRLMGFSYEDIIEYIRFR